MATISDDKSSNLTEIGEDIVRITQELFPGEISTYMLDDPEYPHSRFTVIEAQASGPVEDVVDRRAEWHRRVAGVAQSCSTLRLTLDYHEVC